MEIFCSEIVFETVVDICCCEEDSDIAEDFCSENDSETAEDLFEKISETAWDCSCWLAVVSTVSITELFFVIISLVDSE